MHNLSELIPGEFATVEKLLTSGQMRRRLQDLGICEGVETKCVGISPSGNPKAYMIRGAVIAIRLEDAKNIIIKY